MTLVKLVIGSRGSKLALTQTYWVRDRLQAHNDSLEIEVLKIRTTGDQATGSLRSFGGAGVFTKELERAKSTSPSTASRIYRLRCTQNSPWSPLPSAKTCATR
jgi:hypothetical protein